MALSKKHYEQFAHNIKTEVVRAPEDHGEIDGSIAIEALRRLAVKLSVDFALDNPRFDRQRFMTACGF